MVRTKSVNINADIPFDVYEAVVRPKKEQRKFTKFIISLISAYYLSETVRTIVDNGGEDELQAYITDEVHRTLGKAKESLLMIDVVGSSAKEEADTSANDLAEFRDSITQDVTGIREEFKSFKDDILLAISNLSAPQPSPRQVVPKEEPVITPSVEVPSVSFKLEEDTPIPVFTLQGGDEPEETSVSVEDAISGLLGGF